MDDRLAGCLPGWTLIVRWTYGLKDGRMDRWMDEWMHDSLLQLQLQFQFQLPLQLFPVPCSLFCCPLLVGYWSPVVVIYLLPTRAHTHTHKYTSHAATPSRVTEDHGPIELMICGAKCEADSALPLKGNWNFSSPKIVDVFTHFYSRLDPLFLFPPFRFHLLLASGLLFVFWVYSFLTFIK